MLRPSTLALPAALTLATSAPLHAQSRARVDPVTTDVATRDTARPAALAELHFTSAGARLNGLLYLAAGSGPHPTVVLLHGYPGNERNLDLAQSIRRAGMNVLFFHYRGAWGSGGDFSFANAQADVAAALAYLRDSATAVRHRVDRRRLALVGHSMGGWLALRGAAADADVRCVAGLEIADMSRRGARGDSAAMKARADFIAYTADLTSPGGPLRAAMSADSLVGTLAANADAWSLPAAASALRDRPVLLLDNTVNADHAPLVAALKQSGARRVTTHVWPTDHSFSDRRVALGRTVVEWLRTSCWR
jgi:pimeloyl-ACP methyl ester carboxylesterase